MLVTITRKKHETDQEVFNSELDEDARGFTKVVLNSNLIRGIIPVEGMTVGEVSSIILYQLTDDLVVLYEAEHPISLINNQLRRTL